MRIKEMKLRTKIAVGVTAAATAVLGGGAALAFFTSTGAGNGGASVGSAGNNIAVVGASGSTLYPGGAPDTITFTAYNFSEFNQAISNIHVTGVQACSVAFVYAGTDTYAHASAAPTCADTGAQATTDASCVAGGVATDTSKWFQIADTAVSPTGDGNLAPATGAGPTPSSVVLTETGTANMLDQNVNQNACEGLNLNFTFTTS